MLATFRSLLNKWPGRVFFLGLAAVFVLWGVSGKINLSGDDNAAATVAGHTVQLPDLQEEYRRELAQTTRMLGGTEPTADMRRMVAMQSVSRLVTQAAMLAEAKSLGVTVPDDALRDAAFEVPAFHGQNGQFDRALMQNVLRNNGLNEGRFLELLRGDLTVRQLLEAQRAGTVAPDAMAREVFAFEQEKRVADAVDVPLAGAATPPAPTDLQLQRWYANNLDKYSRPEYRRIKAIVLAPETLAKEIQVSDDDLKAAWEQHKGEYNKPEHRTVQVILTQDEAEAQKLATLWATGMDWAGMQQEANKTGAAPVELSDASRAEFPAPELGDAVFATPEGVVPPPVHSALGWHVLKVVKVSPGGATTLAEAHDALVKRVIADKAADLMYDRANRIENLLSSGTALDGLPGDLGVAAVTGTLDAAGMTQDGQPAPIPGPPELRTALVQAVFAAKKGEQPKLTQAPNGADGAQSFYAATVEDIIAPTPRPFAEVEERVRLEWAGNVVRREREAVAAGLLAAVKGGQSLADAAAKAGLTMRTLPATGRAQPAEGFPPALLNQIFTLHKGEPTMVETQDGFLVAVLEKIEEPDPKADPVGYGQVRDGLARAISEDIATVFATAVRDRANPRINQSVVDSVVAPGE